MNYVNAEVGLNTRNAVVNKYYNFIERYIEGVKSKKTNDILKRRKMMMYPSDMLPENDFCIAVKTDLHCSQLSNILDIDKDDIEYLANKYFGKLQEELSINIKAESEKYSNLIDEFKKESNGK